MNEVPGAPREGAEVTPEPTGSFMTRLVAALTAPKQLYADIARGAHWWEPWVWVSIISMVVAWMSIPIQIQIARVNPRGISAEELEQTVEAMEKFGFLGVVSTPVVLLIATLIVGGVSYMLVSLLAEESSFRKYFSLVLWANVPVAIGQLLGVGLARMKGVESIRSIHDASASFGPAYFLDPTEHQLLYPIMTSLDIFYIWFYALVAGGLVAVFKMSTRNAVLTVIPIWLLQVLFAVIGARVNAG